MKEIVLYTKRYRGQKVTFNSRKGSGIMIEGVAIQVVPESNVVLLRDSNHYLHAVSNLTIESI
tara:strand:+ start:793 stop:981 length:189 start_codon:yes stop_codon:yes gene_type:complete